MNHKSLLNQLKFTSVSEESLTRKDTGKPLVAIN